MNGIKVKYRDRIYNDVKCKKKNVYWDENKDLTMVFRKMDKFVLITITDKKFIFNLGISLFMIPYIKYKTMIEEINKYLGE